MTKFAIEQSDRDMARYGKVHAHGCKDLRDPEAFTTDATTLEGVQEAASEATGWEPDEFKFAPCATKLIKKAGGVMTTGGFVGQETLDRMRKEA
jgi:hypothetical protein